MLRTLGVIIRHLEGMKAVTNSQPVAQETTVRNYAVCCCAGLGVVDYACPIHGLPQTTTTTSTETQETTTVGDPTVTAGLLTLQDKMRGTTEPEIEAALTDAPACEHPYLRAPRTEGARPRTSRVWWAPGDTGACTDCGETFVLGWVPAGSA